jgi:peptidoglycan/xylan/chitin deacetylase (PgdA/CDA1 family)
MLRRAVKTAGSWALYASGADRWIGVARGVEREPLVLCYHRVVRDPRQHPASAPAMLVSQRTLAAQLDWVGLRYRFVDLDELAEGVVEGRRHRRPIAAVTFDDGYADVYHNALPVLQRKGIPAAVFVVTELIGTKALLVHDRLHALMQNANARLGGSAIVSLCDRHRLECVPPRTDDAAWTPAQITQLTERLLATQTRALLERLVGDLEKHVAIPSDLVDTLRPLDWPMLAAMKAAGVVVGSHTRSHCVLPNEDTDHVIDELLTSKRTLEARLGGPIRHFSFPNGHFTPDVLRAVRATGYRYAYTSCFHRSPQLPGLTIPRRVFWERSIAGLAAGVSPAVASCQVRGVFDDRDFCPHDHQAPPVELPSYRAEAVRS